MKKDFHAGGKGMLLLLLVPTLLCTAIRIYQLFCITEAGTGFYTVRNRSVPLMYALCFLSVLLLIVFGRSAGKQMQSKPAVRKSIPLGFAASLFAAGLVSDAIIRMNTLVSTLMSGAFAISGSRMSFFLTALSAVLSVLACLYMVLFAYSYFTGNPMFGDYKGMALTPLFWCMLRLVIRFMTKISFTEVAELMLEIAALSFMMLFFLAFARICAQLSFAGAMKRALSFGLPAIFFTAIITLSKLAAAIGGKYAFVAEGYPFALSDCGFAVFASVYLYHQLTFGEQGEDKIEDKLETDESFLAD